MTTRKCTVCLEEKPIELFQRYCTNKEGYNTQCKKCCGIKRRAYYQKTKAQQMLNLKRWRENHPEKVKEAVKNYAKLPIQKMQRRLARSARRCLKSKTNILYLSTGCTPEQLRKHIESQFQPGMSWSNYGEWTLDHIVPMRAFDLFSAEGRRKANHYTNLRPLFNAENVRKRDFYKQEDLEKAQKVEILFTKKEIIQKSIDKALVLT